MPIRQYFLVAERLTRPGISSAQLQDLLHRGRIDRSTRALGATPASQDTGLGTAFHEPLMITAVRLCHLRGVDFETLAHYVTRERVLVAAPVECIKLANAMVGKFPTGALIFSRKAVIKQLHRPRTYSARPRAGWRQLTFLLGRAQQT